jgi:hypothetical protein
MNRKLLFLLGMLTSTTAFSQSLISDNFNSYTTGNLGTQGGWARDGGAAAQAKVAEITPTTYGKSLQLDRTTTTNMWIYKAITQWGTRTAGNNILEVKFNFYSGSGTGTTSFQMYADGTDYFNLGFVAYDAVTKELSYYNSTSTVSNTLSTLVNNTWYSISLYYNHTTGNTNVYVNGTSYGPYSGTAGKDIDEIDIFSGVAAMVVGYDNLSFAAVNAVLATDEASVKNSNLKIYPNPTKDFVKVNTDKKITSISIYDLVGKKLIDSQEQTINIKNFASGVYVINIKYKDGSSESKKIVKE